MAAVAWVLFSGSLWRNGDQRDWRRDRRWDWRWQRRGSQRAWSAVAAMGAAGVPYHTNGGALASMISSKAPSGTTTTGCYGTRSRSPRRQANRASDPRILPSAVATTATLHSQKGRAYAVERKSTAAQPRWSCPTWDRLGVAGVWYAPTRQYSSGSRPCSSLFSQKIAINDPGRPALPPTDLLYIVCNAHQAQTYPGRPVASLALPFSPVFAGLPRRYG